MENRNDLEFDKFKRQDVWKSAVRTTTIWWNLVETDLSHSAWWEQIYVMPVSLFHWMWTYDIPQPRWIIKEDTVETPAITSTKVTSEWWALKVTSWIWWSASIESKRHPRYQPNRWHRYATANYIPDVDVAWKIYRWGLWNLNGSDAVQNWIYFQLESGSSGGLYACISSNWTQTKKELIDLSIAEFSATQQAMAKDIYWLEYWTLFDIQFQWRSAWDMFFYVNLKKVHTIKNLWTTTWPTVANPWMSCFYQTIDDTAGASAVMYSWCVDITTEWWEKAWQTYISAINDIWTSTGRSITWYDQPLVIVRVPDTYQWQENTRDTHLLRISVSSDQKWIMRTWITRDITAIWWTVWVTAFTSLKTWSDLEWIDCVPLSATEITFDKTKCEEVFSTRVPQDWTIVVENPSTLIEYVLWHWDYLILTGHRESWTWANMFWWIEMWQEI